MNLRSVFFNASSNLRAGWRITLFLLLQLCLSVGIGGILAALLGVSSPVVMAVVYAILLFSTFVSLKLIDRRPFLSVGLPLHRRLGLEWTQGFFISFFMISIVFVVEYLLGYVDLTWRGMSLGMVATSFLSMLVVFAWFGFGEELLFRGYCFQTLIEGTNQYVAIISLSALFGLAHVGNPNATLFGVLNTVLAGIWLSVAYLKTRTLWFPTSLHATWNFFQGYVYSFPVSGLQLESRSLFSLQQTGPDWLTGGAYGPEAGVLSTIVLVIATIFIVKSPSIRIGEGVWMLTAQPVAQPEINVSEP